MESEGGKEIKTFTDKIKTVCERTGWGGTCGFTSFTWHQNKVPVFSHKRLSQHAFALRGALLKTDRWRCYTQLGSEDRSDFFCLPLLTDRSTDRQTPGQEQGTKDWVLDGL